MIKKYNLPKIPIPEFHGDPLDWAPFWEPFTTAVDSNTTLSEADKLTYLRAAIKPWEAIEIVSASTAKYNGYSTIVGLLKKRYEKRRLVHRLHVKALTQHQAKTNSYEEISKLHVTWKKHLAGLHDSGQYEVGAVLTSIAVSNLNHGLYDKWLTFTQERKEIPDIEVFLDFLEERMDTTAPSTPSSKQHSHQHKRPRAMVHSTSVDKTCGFCKVESHPLYLCSAFKGLSLDQRNDSSESLKLCHNCLSAGHYTKSCKSPHRYKKCNRLHHSLLHDESRAQANSL